MLPNLTEDQYTQVITALNPTPQIPQDNAAPATEYATGLLHVAQNRWILDSGATHHITFSPTSLINVKKPVKTLCQVAFYLCVSIIIL